MALLKDTGTVIYCVNDILLLLQYSFFKNLEKHKDNPFIAEILFKAKSTFKYSNQIESLVKREIDYFTIDEFTHLLNLLKESGFEHEFTFDTCMSKLFMGLPYLQTEFNLKVAYNNPFEKLLLENYFKGTTMEVVISTEDIDSYIKEKEISVYTADVNIIERYLEHEYVMLFVPKELKTLYPKYLEFDNVNYIEHNWEHYYSDDISEEEINDNKKIHSNENK